MARYPLDSFTITQGFSAQHQALDLAAPQGTLVKSPVTGTVTNVGTNPKYAGGLYVIVREDGSGREYYTGHHSETNVSVGQRVSEGQVVAKVGATGQATGPHVHFQVRERGGGALLDPHTLITNPAGESMKRLEAWQVDENFARLIFMTFYGEPRPSRAQLEGIMEQDWRVALNNAANSDQWRTQKQHVVNLENHIRILEADLARIRAERDQLRENADLVSQVKRIADVQERLASN